MKFGRKHLDPTVIYEDKNLLAINKPSGLVVHSGVNTSYTLADWIKKNYPSILGVGESYIDQEGKEIPRPGIVHRLDKDTSGAMLIAKNQEFFETLKKHFQKGKVEKEYHAFVYGKPKRPRGTVRLSIGKSRRDFRKQTTQNIRGVEREAQTEYVLSKTCPDKTSFMQFYPKTGRTHQIRVHARSLQIPIINDPLYAKEFSRGREPLLDFKRLALHSRRITIFTHFQEEPLDIIAPYPKDFERALSICSG